MAKPRAITSLSEFTESFNMLLYCDSGGGKTVLAGSALRALFLATEKGTISAKRFGSTADLWLIDGHDELMKAYSYLEENPEDYDFVLLDGLTPLQEILWRESIFRGININPDRDPDVLSQQDYLRVQNQLKEIVRIFNDLPQNIIYTAQTMRAEDVEDDVLRLPLLSGKKGEFAQKICGMVHVVGYLGVVTPREGEPFRRLYTQTQNNIFAKDRYDAIGTIDKPTVPKIMAKVNDSIKAATSATAPAAAKKTAAPAAKKVTVPAVKKAAARRRTT